MIYRFGIALLLCVVFPLFVFTGFLVAILSGFPILFRQKRVGKDGRPFVMYKFRTMVPIADTLQKKYQNRNESQGPAFKIQNDPRFTDIGKVLSHTGLDELPQLFNVLRGDMALIGPRPLPVSEAKKLKPWMHERERILPGIISPAILTGAYHQDFEGWMRSDVAYVKEKSLRQDASLFVRFVPFIVRLVVSAV